MSWWADSWRSAFEGEVFDDVSRQRAGRNLRRRVDMTVELEPGAATARFVKGAEAVATTVTFGLVAEEGWTKFCRLVGQRPAVAAAVLTGQLPADVESEAAAAGISLSPTGQTVSSVCSCDEWDEPCTHVWALVEDLVDTISVDPFTVLVLIGRSREQLVDQVRMARSGRSELNALGAEPRGPDGGVLATDAFARTPALLPAARPVPRSAGRPVGLPTPPPSDSGVAAADLVALVDDAARRATAVLQGVDVGGLHRSIDADLIRRAARFTEPVGSAAWPELERLASAASVSVEELRASAVAWRLAGDDGLAAHSERWEPEPHLLNPALGLLGAKPRVTGNVVAGNGFQLRFSTDHRWWRFDANDQLGWVLASDGFADPADALPDS